MSPHHAVIIAGGAGTRLWPLSRRDRPKQLLRLFEGRCLLEIARQRLAGLFPPEHTWIIAARRHLPRIAELLPDLPADNLIGEPEGRDTANAIGLAAEFIAERAPDALMSVFTADHLITPQSAFEDALYRAAAAAAAHPQALLAYGIRPTEAHTGYGYLELGDELSPGLRRVAAFTEKPDIERAQGFLKGGRHLWNSGMFTWSLAALREEFRRCLPEQADGLAAIAEALRRGDVTAADAGFCALRPISIDYGVMERAREVLAISMECRWLDMGSWTSIAAAGQPDARGNVSLGGTYRAMESNGCILASEGDDDHLVAIVGVHDLVVVRSADATLICHKDSLERIRALVAELDARRQ